MTSPQFLDAPSGRRLAFHKTDGAGPCVVLLGGYMSDMTGTKALHLQAWAEAQGRAFLRFDYSGHGQSSGAFTDGTIGQWAEDAAAVIAAQTDGPLILVGSSMGGWITFLTALALPARVAGIVTIAAAPDFTEDGFWASFDEATRAKLMAEGAVEVPNDYDTPYIVTREFIEDGRKHLVLRQPLPLPVPVRMLQGTEDTAVETATALRLLDHIDSPDLRLSLVKGADHSFSSPDCLAQLEGAIDEVTDRWAG